MLRSFHFGVPAWVALAAVVSPVTFVSQVRADDAKYFHLNATVFELREAKEEIRGLKGVKEGLREKALGAIDNAISHTKQCLDDLGVPYKYVPPEKEPYPAGEDHKHLRHALRQIKQGKEELRAVKGIMSDHRDAALAAMDKASEVIKDLVDSLK
jgi:hypothetical protein